MGNNKVLQVIARMLVVALLVVLGWFILYYFVKLTFPFLIAAVFAFFMNPLVNILEKKARFPRPLAVLTGILVLFGLVGGLLTLIIIKLIDGFHYLSRFVPQQIEMISRNLQTYFNEHVVPLWMKGLGIIDELDPAQQNAIETSIQQLGGQFASILGNAGQAIANSLSHLVGALPLTLTVFLFVLLGLYFISKDWNRLKMWLKEKLPIKASGQVASVYRDLKTKLVGFLTAQFILISMTAVVNFIGLLILNIEQALTIALILGLVDLLPYLGTGLILIPWGIYCLVTGDLFLGFGLLILYTITIVLRQLAEPKVLSSSLGLNPLATLVSLFAGLQLFGFIGLFIGPVLLVLLVSLYEAKVFSGLWRFISGNQS